MTEPQETTTTRIPPIHPDTIAFEALLGRLEKGQRISYEDLAAAVRRDLKKERGSIASHIRSAERRLLNGQRMVFAAYHDVEKNERGRVRLDDVSIQQHGELRTTRIYKASRQTQRILACADVESMPADRRLRLSTSLIACRGAERFTGTTGREKIARIVANTNGSSQIPILESAWKALQAGS